MNFYVYDFDGTIYDGDSTFDFIKFLIKKDKSIILHIPKMLLYLIKYKLKLIPKETMKEVFFEIFNKFNNIDKLVSEFWKLNKKNIKSFWINKKSHKNDIIASASPYFLLEPIAKMYKIKDLFASPVDRNTGKYLGKNCHNVEKVKHINNKYPNCTILEMYSDDIKADKPLLDLAEKSYVVKKNKIIDYKECINNKQNIIKKFWDWGWNIYHKNEEIWNYLIVGGLTTLVSLFVYYLCVSTFLNPNNPIELQTANIISWIVSVIFAYFTNRVYVFKSTEPNKIKEATKFIGSRITTLILDMLTMLIFVSILNINDKISKIIAQFIVIIGNYIISKLLVFNGKINKNYN